jgi:Rieske Fe-S protein
VTDSHSTTGLTTTRRTVLVAGAGGAGLVVLAACSNGGSSGSGSGNGSGNGGGSSTQPANKPLATLAEIGVGQVVSVTLPDGTPAIIARPTSAGVVCHSAICTHQGCVVNPDGQRLVCPCHGSQFNAMTGAVLQGPAASPLPKIPVKVADGKVVTTSSA